MTFLVYVPCFSYSTVAVILVLRSSWQQCSLPVNCLFSNAELQFRETFHVFCVFGCFIILKYGHHQSGFQFVAWTGSKEVIEQELFRLCIYFLQHIYYAIRALLNFPRPFFSTAGKGLFYSSLIAK